MVRIILAGAIAALISGCGGGGGGDDPKTSQLTFNVEAAMASVLTPGVNFTGMTASVPVPNSYPERSTNYRLAFSSVPTSSGQLVSGGETLRRTVQTLSVEKEGVQSSATSATVYYRLIPTQLVAAARSDGETVSYVSPGALPTAALVGQSGTFNTFTSGSGTGVTTWSLEADSETTAWACFTTTISGAPDALEKYCYRITAAGAISDAKITFTLEGRAATFTGGTMSIPAKPANTAPVANAGTSKNVATGSVVTLDGSASADANSDPLTYLWVISSKPDGSAAFLSNATAVKPSFTADVAGTYVLSLVVNDGQSSSAAASVTVTAANTGGGVVSNTAPIADAGIAQTVAAGTVVVLNGSGSSDADGDSLTYRWVLTAKPGGSAAFLSDINSVTPSFTADVPGTYEVSLAVNDGKVNSSVANSTVFAALPNQLYMTDMTGLEITEPGAPVPLPFSVGRVVTCGADCTAGVTIGVFKLFASGQSFTLTNVEAKNTATGSTLTPSFIGLTNGQTIIAGQTLIFTVVNTEPAPANLTYKFTVKETGSTFVYTVQLF